MPHPEADPLFLDFQASLAGRYSLERELGRGGMGIVYLARDVRLDRRVAIKLLPPHLAGNAEFRRRFLDEARMAARLSHPNIVTIHAVEDTGPFAWFVLAYVEGETLAHRVEREGPLAIPVTLRILREVAWALGHAHSHGIVHRDIKPENILLEAGSGRALVADFGIAGAIETSGGEPSGRVMGTVQYMSPEQAAGERVDGRSDLYSLGLLAHYMLTGRLPFQGTTAAEVLAQHLTAAPMPLTEVAPAVPAPVARAMDQLLAKDRESRIQSAEALANVLSQALEGQLAMAEPVRRFVALTESAPALRILPLTMLTGLLVYYALELTLLPPLIGGLPWKHVAVEVMRVAVFAGSTVLPLWLTLRRLRRLQASGHHQGETVHALAEDDVRQRSESATQAQRRRAMMAHAGWLGSIVLFGALWTVNLLGVSIPLSLEDVSNVLLAAAAGVAIMGAAPGVEAGIKLGRRSRFWGSKLGSWLFRVARLGLTLPALADSGAGATEIALGHAAVTLYEALPTDIRTDLADLPGLVERLEHEAGALRHILEAAGLEDTRARAQERLTAVVGALETLRLDLLRLRAGTIPLDNLTADLEIVARLSEAADRHLAAHQEVRATLSPSPPRVTAP